jgi:hypothetical protein
MPVTPLKFSPTSGRKRPVGSARRRAAHHQVLTGADGSAAAVVKGKRDRQRPRWSPVSGHDC